MNAKIQGELNVRFGISNSIGPHWSPRQKEKSVILILLIMNFCIHFYTFTNIELDVIHFDYCVWGHTLKFCALDECLMHLNLVPSSMVSSCVNDLVSNYSPRSFCAL